MAEPVTSFLPSTTLGAGLGMGVERQHARIGGHLPRGQPALDLLPAFGPVIHRRALRSRPLYLYLGFERLEGEAARGGPCAPGRPRQGFRPHRFNTDASVLLGRFGKPGRLRPGYRLERTRLPNYRAAA
jgi:hypothetical protein